MTETQIGLILLGVMLFIAGMFFQWPWLSGFLGIAVSDERYSQMKRRYKETKHGLLIVGFTLIVIGFAMLI
jgi:hypothetical protein